MSGVVSTVLVGVGAMCAALVGGCQLDNTGLVAAIRWQADEFQRRVGIRCHVKLPAQHVALDDDLSTALFRVFQELLTNVARHARARSVHIEFDVSEGSLMLRVADDGIGISQAQINSRESLGLLGIRERAQLFRGEVTIDGSPGSGTSITVSIPVPRKPERDERDLLSQL